MKSSAIELDTGATPRRLWVVMPVYNEAATIERVVAEWILVLADADPNFVLLVVDDGSTDATPAALGRIAAGEQRMRLERQSNQGHGAACRRGYEIATASASDAAWILQVDSDGQCDPRDFAAFWRHRDCSPVQFGRRRHREDGVLRTLASGALALAVSMLAGRWLPDSNVPFRLFRRDALTAALAQLSSRGATGRRVELFNAALCAAASDAPPPRWVEIRFRHRLAGRSHYRLGRMLRLAVNLLGWLLLRPDQRSRTARSRGLAAVAWIALAVALTGYAVRNLRQEALWFDEAVQVYTALGLAPFGEPLAPPGGLREVIARNRGDELDPGAFSVLLHSWISLAGTGATQLRAFSGILALAGLAAFAALAHRWWPHPLAAPTAVGLALLQPLVRDQAIEIRPYALELMAVFTCFWLADRFLARPTSGRALTLGLALVVLLGSRYSGFLTVAALAGALVLHVVDEMRSGAEQEPTTWTLLLALLPPLLGAAAIARWSLPGLLARASYQGGRLVSYLAPLTLRGLSVAEALGTAGRNLLQPAALGLTVAAGLACWRPVTPSPTAKAVRRSALLLLVLTIFLWPWHPWDPSTKWSLYLRLASLVCVLRLAADAIPALERTRFGHLGVEGLAIAVIAAGTWATMSYKRPAHWDVALPALHRIDAGLQRPGKVAVALEAMPAVRYHYEFGSLRGRLGYPQLFLFPHDGVELGTAELCKARWLLSFQALVRLEKRYPDFRFTEDPFADQLLRIARRTEKAPCN